MIDIIEHIKGRWSGLGQSYDSDTRKVIENMQLEVNIVALSNTSFEAEFKFTSVRDTVNNNTYKSIYEFKNDLEFTVLPDWSKENYVYLYMKNPISFQGSYFDDSLGRNTRVLDNNFIVESEWQMNIERENKLTNMHTISEYVLNKDS
jgi:hypothetical protein